MLTDLVEGTDVRMADGGCRPRLAEETIPHLRIGRGQDRLERDRSLEPLVDRFVDDAHAAAADLPDDPVMSNVA